MRNIVQMDHEKGVLAIGDVLRSGQTVQFHLRDTEAANEELDLLLKEYSTQSSVPAGRCYLPAPAAASIFFRSPTTNPTLFLTAWDIFP